MGGFVKLHITKLILIGIKQGEGRGVFRGLFIIHLVF